MIRAKLATKIANSELYPQIADKAVLSIVVGDDVIAKLRYYMIMSFIICIRRRAMGWLFTYRESILGYVGGVGSALAALGAVWWFIVQRQLAPQIEFDVDARIIKLDGGPVVAEYTLRLRNNGKVRVKLPGIGLRVRSLNRGDLIEKFDEARLKFPHVVCKLQNVLSTDEDFDFTFLEPGITQCYRVVSAVPTDAILLLIFGEFEYRKGWSHTAERVIEVK